MGRGTAGVDGRMTEIWNSVLEYEGLYEVSNLGRVRSIDRVVGTEKRPVRWKGRLLKPASSGKVGHLSVNLSKCSRTKSFLVHALVLSAFIGPRPNGLEACHGSGGAQDNRLENLRWDTSSENNHDIVRQGRHKNANKSRCTRGHLLVGPNLYRSKTRIERVCKACTTARTLVHRHGCGDLVAIADESYRCSMLGVRASWSRFLV